MRGAPARGAGHLETWRRPSRPAQPPRRGGRASQGPAGCDGRAGRVSETGQVICRASGPPSPGLRQSVGPIVRQPTARDTCGCYWPMPGCCWRMPRVNLRSSTVASAAGVSPKLSAACKHPTAGSRCSTASGVERRRCSDEEIGASGRPGPLFLGSRKRLGRRCSEMRHPCLVPPATDGGCVGIPLIL